MVREEITRADLLALDREDPLRGFRGRFVLPSGIYLDGNSLGPLPKTLPDRLAGFLEGEWGKDLIASWNRHDWIGYPERLGARIAPLLGARAEEVIVADSVSVNLFKLLGALVHNRPGALLADRSHFPTDLYMAEGLSRLLGDRRLWLVEPDEFEEALGAPDVGVATLSHVDFRSGRVRDMRALTEAGRRSGVPVVWDLSHSAGALHLDLRRDRIEYAVGCGYKYLNGGPGAPAFLFVAEERQSEELVSPLSGWMGHARPFDFSTGYEPAPGMRRFLAGTPGVLGCVALEEGLRTFEGVDLAQLQQKSAALGDLFLRLARERLARFGVLPASPERAADRGSHVSLRHPEAFSLMQALIARGVVGDFRQPDLLRFGFAPLFLRHVDIADAVDELVAVFESDGFRDERFRERGRVT